MKPLLILTAGVLLFASAAVADNTPAISKIVPDVSPTSGGVEVTITGGNFETTVRCVVPCPTKVYFGEIGVVPSRNTGSEIVVTAPPHAPGVVNIGVVTGGGRSRTIVDAFTFADSVAEAWEPVLLPVYIDSTTPGAGGSQWKTDFWLLNDGQSTLAVAPWPCPGDQVCPAVFPLTKTLGTGESQHNLPPFFRIPSALPGRLIYLSRRAAANAAMNLRVYDSARAALDAGTEVPVVRERELLTEHTTLVNIPADNSRMLLRIYDVALTDAAFYVRVTMQSEDANRIVLAEYDLHATTADTGELRISPAYAQQELFAPLVAQAGPANVLRVEVFPESAGSRYWAFVSVTNNSTSHVTTVTPQ